MPGNPPTDIDGVDNDNDIDNDDNDDGVANDRVDNADVAAAAAPVVVPGPLRSRIPVKYDHVCGSGELLPPLVSMEDTACMVQKFIY